jgi:PAS domain S-box-containing protein
MAPAAREDRMTVAWLISVVIIQTTAAILLAVTSVSLLRQLRQKSRGNQTLIAHQSQVEAEMVECRKREAEAVARQEASQAWYRTTLDHTGDMVLVHGLDADGGPGPFLEANAAACAQLEYDHDDLLGRSLADIQDIEVPIATGFPNAAQSEAQTRKLARKAVQNAIDKAMRGKPIYYEDSFRTSKGQKIPLELTVFRSDHLGQPRIVWVARDVSQIRAGQRAVKESQKRMEDFFSHSPVGISMFDADRRLIAVNRACLRMFGMPDAQEFEHFNLFENRFLPPADKQALGRGESIQCEIVVDFDDVREKGVFSSHRRGKGHFEILISNLGMDGNYRPRGYFAQLEDVTQRRKVEADLRRLQAQGTAEEGIGGALEDVALTDIVQVFCAGGRNMELSISHRGVEARMYMQNGNITHCTAGDKAGEEAFYDLMCWRQGKFTAKPCTEFPPRTITVSVMSLLMESARRMDGVAPE